MDILLHAVAAALFTILPRLNYPRCCSSSYSFVKSLPTVLETAPHCLLS